MNPTKNCLYSSIFWPLAFCLLISIHHLVQNAHAAISESEPKCSDLPHSNFLTTEQLNRACLHRKMWMHDRDVNGLTKFEDKVTANQLAYINSLARQFKPAEDLSNFVTKTPFFANDERTRRKPRKIPHNLQPKMVRKEFRMLSDNEREALGRAMNILKHKTVDNVSIWDLHTLIHYPDSAPGAHWGPAFLPWHREFLRQFETALRNEIPGVSLPYWDSTLDEGLPEPSDSILWSEELMGNGNGYVKTGPFKDWDTNVLMPLSPVPVKKLYRSTGGRSQDRLLSLDDINWIITRNNFSDLTFCHDKTFESMHGLSHVWVGGFMFVIRVSPNDPTFYMHHSFIDYIWEQFRLNRQTREQREREWPRKICDSKHSFNEQMKPFNLKNREGLSNDYTDFWYEYQPVRHCTSSLPFCDSKFYFCDNKAWRCRSRVQVGGNCTGFVDTEICYNSICVQNTCRKITTETVKGAAEKKENRKTGVVWAKTLLLGEGEQPLLTGTARITITDQITGDNSTVFLQKSSQYPELPGLVYLPLPHPRDNLYYNVTLDARDEYDRYCQSYCLNGTTDQYQVCESKLILKSRFDSKASNISYTHSFNSRRFLDMDLSVHPSEWRVTTPYIVFACHSRMIDSDAIKQIADLSSPMELTEYVWFRVNILKKSDSTINLDDAEIEVEDLNDPYDTWISSIRRARSIYDQSVVFVRAKNPRVFRRGVNVRISIRKNNKRIVCEAKCNMDSEKSCDGTVFLHERPRQSQETTYASDPSYLQLLGWRMIGHPAEWNLKMAYLSFYC